MASLNRPPFSIIFADFQNEKTQKHKKSFSSTLFDDSENEQMDQDWEFGGYLNGTYCIYHRKFFKI